jgi:hypothetical protein
MKSYGDFEINGVIEITNFHKCQWENCFRINCGLLLSQWHTAATTQRSDNLTETYGETHDFYPMLHLWPIEVSNGVASFLMPYPSTSMDPKQNSIFYFTFWLCSPMIMGHQVCACSISDFGNMAGSKRNVWPNIAYEAFQTLTTIKWKGIKRNKKKLGNNTGKP